jgi:hypothetical protein
VNATARAALLDIVALILEAMLSASASSAAMRHALSELLDDHPINARGYLRNALAEDTTTTTKLSEAVKAYKALSTALDGPKDV